MQCFGVCYLGSWWQTAPCWRKLPFKYGALGWWGHFTHTARVLCSRRRGNKHSQFYPVTAEKLAGFTISLKLASLTEQSSCNVCRQPERSFLTQQPDSLSFDFFSWISLWISSSWRMQGENFAPRWISASCRTSGTILQLKATQRNLKPNFPKSSSSYNKIIRSYTVAWARARPRSRAA